MVNGGKNIVKPLNTLKDRKSVGIIFLLNRIPTDFFAIS